MEFTTQKLCEKMNKIKPDLISGFNVFLLALPLCLGIALASNCPPISGILSAIVGGVIVSWLGGCQLSIKGPAAGLVVIVLASVQDLGGGDLQLGYERALAVGVVAALIQIILGLTRKAIIAEVIPPPVIHGMLAAVGFIIVIKQSYVMLGIPNESGSPFQLLTQLPMKLYQINPFIMSIGLAALSIAMIWPRMKKVSFIPSSIIVLGIAIPISLYLDISNTHVYTIFGHSHTLDSSYLIHVPTGLSSAFTFPDFSVIASWTSLKYIIILSLVGSIESLLTVSAVDSIAQKEKSSDLNKDLRSLGIGNLISSLIGGIPMISEIIRSKANIDYGAQSFLSNFFHGFFLLLSVIFLGRVIDTIPLAALAGLLVFVGLRLVSPREFIHVYKIGRDQFVLFMTTFLMTLMVDLLMGVLSGIILKIFILVLRGNNFLQIFKPLITVRKKGDVAYIEIEGPFTFAGYLQFKDTLNRVRQESNHIIIDLDSVSYMDHTVLVKLRDLKREFRDIQIVLEENQQLAHFYTEETSKFGF